MKKLVLFVFSGLVILFLLIQVVPYGRNHQNPPVVQEPRWPSNEVRSLAQRSCFDCHSNESVWPWYSNIAPVSWLVYRDVAEGREKLNFSVWGQGEIEAEDLPEVVLEGEMPMRNYILLHPEARLTPAEKQTLADGLAQIAGSLPGEWQESDGEADDDDD